MKNGFLSRRVLDALFLGQLVLVIVAVVVVVTYAIDTAREVQQISERQALILQQQNNFQICNQHVMLDSLKDIARKLGLPTEDIMVPSVKGLNCP